METNDLYQQLNHEIFCLFGDLFFRLSISVLKLEQYLTSFYSLCYVSMSKTMCMYLKRSNKFSLKLIRAQNVYDTLLIKQQRTEKVQLIFSEIYKNFITLFIYFPI